MQTSETTRRVMARAAVQAGGIGALARRLNVTQKALGEYLVGNKPIPDALFLAVVDVVLEGLPDPAHPARAEPAARGPLHDS